MSVFSQNIKLLRKRKRFTQDEVAQSLSMKRSTLSGYENEVAHPNMQVLIAFSDYFNVSIDTLIKVDLPSLTESQMNQLERGYDVFIKGRKLRVLTTTVGADNEEKIELVAEKAKAGYASGFADPEYIKVLHTFRLPFLSKQKKYRTFQISGDSMLPIPDRAYVTGEYVQNWNMIKDKGAYIIITLDDGVVFKVVENKIKNDNKFKLHSLNSLYEPYDLMVSEIREVWRFVNYISSEIPESNEMRQDIVQSLDSLRREVKQMQTKLNL